jgi:hypothetical protein
MVSIFGTCFFYLPCRFVWFPQLQWKIFINKYKRERRLQRPLDKVMCQSDTSVSDDSQPHFVELVRLRIKDDAMVKDTTVSTRKDLSFFEDPGGNPINET